MKILLLLAALCAGTPVHADAVKKTYAFGVLNQRSLQATALYWNPILSHVSARSGVPLELHIGRTAQETTDRVTAGQVDFAYTNHLFTPARARLGWRVLARQDTPGIRGQIVVRETSPAQTLHDLEGQTVVFANAYAFAGYYVPMDALLRAGVQVTPEFAGNQEAAMARMAAGTAAAGVNDQIMRDFAQRTGLKYRVLAESEPYFDLAVMVSPRVDPAVAERVRKAFIDMKHEPEGQRVLQRVAKVFELAAPRGFVAADDSHYANYRAFFARTRVKLDD